MPEFFGLDIGSHSIKLVQLQRKEGGIALTSFAKEDSPAQILKSEAEADERALSETLREVKKRAGIKTDDVVVSLPESKLFTSVVEFPQMNEKELASALEYEAEKNLPVSAEEATYDFNIVSHDNGNGKMDVLLVAAPNTLLDRYLEILEAAKLHVLALEPEVVAYARALVKKDDAAPTLITSIGSSTTDLIVVEGGKIRFTRSVSTGGRALGRALTQAFGFSEEQAESYKRNYGLADDELEGKISDALRPVFRVIVEEMEKSLDFYHSRKETGDVKRIILSGGSAHLPGVVVYLAKQFDIEVQLGNPWEGITIGDDFDAKELEEGSGSLAVAVGLALWEED